MKTFKEFEESAVDLENKIRDYLLKKKQVSGKLLKDKMKKYDRYNELESLVKNLITDGEIEFKLDGKKKVTRMKDFYSQQYKLKKSTGDDTYDYYLQHELERRKEKATETDKLTILTQKNTFRWIGG
jgi:hypothetical protein